METTTSPPQQVSTWPHLALDEDIDEVIYFAYRALQGDENAREYMLDALSDIIRYSETRYMEGLAELASMKRNWGYVLAADEQLFREVLEFIAAPACDEASGVIYVETLARELSVDDDARIRLVELAREDCLVARHIVGLLLLVPPIQGLRQQ